MNEINTSNPFSGLFGNIFGTDSSILFFVLILMIICLRCGNTCCNK